MLMDEGLGYVRTGHALRVSKPVKGAARPSYSFGISSPIVRAHQRRPIERKVPLPVYGYITPSPMTFAAHARAVALQLAQKPAIAETAAAQGVTPNVMISRIMQQPAVQAAVSAGTPPAVLATQIAARPESVADALETRPPLMMRTSPTIDVTDVPPDYAAMPSIPTFEPSSETNEPQEDIFASMRPDTTMEDDNMNMGNIRSSIMLPEIRSDMGYARSEMDGMGNIYSDLMTGYMTSRAQKTSVALAQQQTAQAEAAARIADAQARAATAAAAARTQAAGGFKFSPMMLLPVAAGLGIILFLKMKKRK